MRNARTTLMFGLPAPPVPLAPGPPSKAEPPIADGAGPARSAETLTPEINGGEASAAAPRLDSAAMEGDSERYQQFMVPTDPGLPMLVATPFPDSHPVVEEDAPSRNNRPRVTPVILTPVTNAVPASDLTPDPRIPIGVDSTLQRERARATLKSLESRSTPKPRAKRRRRRLQAAAFIAVAIVSAAAVFYWIEQRRRKEPSAEASNALTKAALQLRRDDRATLSQAGAIFAQLAAAYPNYLEAKANQLLVSALQFDDARAEEGRLRAEVDEKMRLKTKIETTKALADWQSRANALGDEVELLRKRAGGLEKAAADLKKQMSVLSGQTEARAEENAASVRARALMFGVTGDNQVIALAERYRTLGGTDGWGTIALAEYAVNTIVPPDTARQVRADIETLRKDDPTFLRAHVLAARLDMVQRKFEQAAVTLDAVVAMNPVHDSAIALRGEAQGQAAAKHP